MKNNKENKSTEVTHWKRKYDEAQAECEKLREHMKMLSESVVAQDGVEARLREQLRLADELSTAAWHMYTSATLAGNETWFAEADKFEKAIARYRAARRADGGQ